jgi:serine phosphatase RsbU (regulator of sigma subunit)
MQKKTKIFKILFFLIVIIAITSISYFRIFDVFEFQTLDLRFKARPPQRENKDIVIIEIAEDTINKIGRWPFERIWHAELINILAEYQAKSIVFDLIFSEESFNDEALINATKRADRVYYPHIFKLDEHKKAFSLETEPLKKLAEVSRGIGHINIISDTDGKNRRVPIYLEYGNKYYPQLAFLVACDYLGVPQDRVLIKANKFVQITPQIRIPVDNKYQMLINYAGRWSKTFRHYSYVDILKSYSQIKKGKKPIINLDELKDKVCFVGLTASGLHDLNPSPLEPRYPNLGIHANIFNSIVENNFLIRVNKFLNLSILVFFLTIITSLTLKTRISFSVYFVVAILIAYIILSFALFIFFGIWIDLFYPLLVAILLYVSLVFFKYLLELHKRKLIEKELDLAREIQKSFLPITLPQRKTLSIASSMTPAKHVAGDLYQFIEFSENTIGIVVGDVSGKGVPAALFMAKIISELKFQAKDTMNPSLTLSNLNTSLCLESKTGFFVTLSYAIINEKERKIILSDGGHLPVLLRKGDTQEVISLQVSGGMPLGLMESVEFSQKEFQFSSGDVLVFYSDGVTEAKNIKKEEFGQERLIETLKRCTIEKNSSEILKDIEKEIKKFTGRAPQHDDITLVVVKVR